MLACGLMGLIITRNAFRVSDDARRLGLAVTENLESQTPDPHPIPAQGPYHSERARSSVGPSRRSLSKFQKRIKG